MQYHFGSTYNAMKILSEYFTTKLVIEFNYGTQAKRFDEVYKIRKSGIFGSSAICDMIKYDFAADTVPSIFKADKITVLKLIA